MKDSNKKQDNNRMVKEFKFFSAKKIISFFLKIFALIIVVVIFLVIKKNFNDVDNFHSISIKESKNIYDKNEVFKKAYKTLSDLESTVVGPTTLNLAYAEGELIDGWSDSSPLANLGPVPITMEDEEHDEFEEEKHSIAFQVFEKLQNKYRVLYSRIYNLCDIKPIIFANVYHVDKKSLLGKYNPEMITHIKGNPETYYVSNFSNVNMKYFDADGNPIEDDNNIKDIMSMASVYTYYHNIYDYNTFLNYCYDLFDNSYTYVASVSNVYFCSGCMHYDDIDSIGNDISYDKITREHSEQNVPKKEQPHKAGTLIKMKEDSYNVKAGSYDEYVNDIYNGKNISDNNYCPGHIDLNISIYVKTLNSQYGLIDIDNNYGNNVDNINKYWNGWDVLMQNRARKLTNRDWEAEYGISISYVDFVKPLTQEEINYYLSRLPGTISNDRKNVIETALRSVGRIPYYYGGKTLVAGFNKNGFGRKVRSDYKGRCLRGLDCSGWVNWVYHTAMNRQIIKSEGTAKLAGEGRRITRKDLLPGDVIVRPGIDSHVMMFLEWAPGGKMKVIHENGSVNNVSIGVYDAYYPYYRRIIEAQ